MKRICSVPFDTTVPVLVVKVRHRTLHYGGLGIIRTLGRVGVPVYAVHEGRLASTATSRYLTGGFVWATSCESAERLLDGLVSLGKRLADRPILIPTDDFAAIFVAEHQTRLDEWFAFQQPPSGLPRSLASKQELYRLCKKLDVPCPEAVFPSSLAEVEQFLDRVRFPVVVKGAEPWLLPRGAGVRSTTIVQSPEQLLAIYSVLEGRSGANLMFQEYIPQEHGEDWIFHGYCNADSDCLKGFTGVKARSYPPYAGPTSLGRSIANETLRRQVEELLQAISYRGIMDLDFRLDRRDGQYKLLDFNPRVGAQFRLFEDDLGIDVVRALHLDLTGRAVPQGRRMQSRVFIVENNDLLASWRYRRDGRLTVWSWLRSLGGSREHAWLAADDLVPFLAMCARFLLRSVRPRRIRYRRPNHKSGPRYVPGRRHRTLRSLRKDGTGRKGSDDHSPTGDGERH